MFIQIRHDSIIKFGNDSKIYANRKDFDMFVYSV